MRLRRAGRASVLAVAASLLVAPSPPRSQGGATFDSFWHDGKAELDGYRYSVTRYGEPRRGSCVMIFVTEPFSESKRVKADDASRNPRDTFDALKLNLVRDFQTGIYDYDTMVSTFVRSANFEPVKIAFTSAEWCGQVYEELRVEQDQITGEFRSYFEDQSWVGSIDRPRGGVTEDELFIALRGLRGDFLRPGERRRVPFLPSAFHRRLTHAPLRWSSAVIQRLSKGVRVATPAGTFQTIVYIVRPDGGREGRVHIERAYPHRVVRWEWKLAKPGAGPLAADGNDAGVLTGSARLEYWKLQGNGHERYLKQLGLKPPAP